MSNPPTPESPRDSESEVSADRTVPVETPAAPGLSRRGLLALGGGVGLAVGAVAGGITGIAVTKNNSSSAAELEYSFYGEHQSGIITPAQDRMHFAAFDMRDDATRDDLISLLQDWSYATSRMMMGLDVSAKGAFRGGPYLPPEDTGEASGLGPSGLTITFGF